MVGRPREFERDEALESAMELFWEQGFESTGVAEICEATGLGRQSLYNTFGDKRSLFEEALHRYFTLRIRPVIERLEQPGPGLDAVRAVLTWWERAASDFASRGCLMANSIAEFGMRVPRISRQLASMLSQVESAFVGALERAREGGELPVSVDPRTLARHLTTLGQGLAAVGRLDPTGALARDSLASVRALLDGLAAAAAAAAAGAAAGDPTSST